MRIECRLIASTLHVKKKLRLQMSRDRHALRTYRLEMADPGQDVLLLLWAFLRLHRKHTVRRESRERQLRQMMKSGGKYLQS